MSLHLVENRKNDNEKIIADLESVTKTFSNGETVIQDLNLSVYKSDFITLIKIASISLLLSYPCFIIFSKIDKIK